MRPPRLWIHIAMLNSHISLPTLSDLPRKCCSPVWPVLLHRCYLLINSCNYLFLAFIIMFSDNFFIQILQENYKSLPWQSWLVQNIIVLPDNVLSSRIFVEPSFPLLILYLAYPDDRMSQNLMKLQTRSPSLWVYQRMIRLIIYKKLINSTITTSTKEL